MNTFSNKSFFFIIILFASLQVCGQRDDVIRWVEFSNDLHQMRQFEGSNQYVMDYFRHTNILFNRDTVYVILIPPMKCSRCEGVINPFIHELKKTDPESIILVMAFYPKTGALNHYIQERQFRADHTLASTEFTFLENFYFSADELQVPFIAKFNISTGDLIIGKSTLGLVMDNEFVQWLRSCYLPIKKHTAPLRDSTNGRQFSVPEIDAKNLSLPVLKPSREIVLGEEEGHPISRVLFPAFNKSLSYFSFMDELSFDIYLYHISEAGLIFMEAIAPGIREEKLFIDRKINDTVFKVLKKMNIINSMYFSSTFIDDTLIITSSLPNIFWQDSTGEELAYYNQSTFLFRKIEEDSIARYIVPEMLPDSNLTFEHLNTYFIDGGKTLCLPVSKGWPVSGTEMLNQVVRQENPFIDEFYNDIPLFAVYNHEGKFQHYFGHLDPLFKEYKLGYSFSSPKIRSKDGIYWFTDKYTGKIWGSKKLSQQKPNYRIDVFEVPDYQSTLEIDRDPLKYIQDYKDVFTQSILDFQVYQDRIYVLVRHGDFYYYKKFSTKGRLLEESLLPSVYDNMQAIHFVLNVNEEHQWLIGVYESAELTSLLVFN